MICQRCLKQNPADIHTCTPTPRWREMEQKIEELQKKLSRMEDGLRLSVRLNEHWERYRVAQDCMPSFIHARRKINFAIKSAINDISEPEEE